MSARTIFCTVCDLSIKNSMFSAHLRSTVHKSNSAVEIGVGIEKVSSAFRSRIASYRVRNVEGTDETTSLPAEYMSGLRARVRQLLQARLLSFDSIKVNFELYAEFTLATKDAIEIKSFATANIVIHKSYNFNELFNKVVETISTKIDEFEERDSGWSFLKCLHLEVNINKYNPLRASGFINLPKALKLKRACINVQNGDQFCFLWSIMAALFPAKNNAHRTSSYPHFKTVLNTKNMTYPVNFSDIKTFEKNNSRISINVYGLKNNTSIVGPLYRTEHRKKHHINLLYMEKGNQSHYCLIKNLSRLLRPQLTKHHGKVWFCDDCMIFFENEHKFHNHVCGGVATILPSFGTLIQFKNFERKQDMPFVIYADFESLLQPVPDESSSNRTNNLQMHIPAAFAYNVVCSYNTSLNRYVSYRGQDCVEVFLDNLRADVLKIWHIYKKPLSMTPLTAEEEKEFAKAEFCYICNHTLFDDRVRDHCHLTGTFRGPAHSYCNLKFSLPQFIPVMFHNLSGYDSHLFIRQLGHLPGPLKVVAKNKENYISFTKFFETEPQHYMAVRFVDSFKFLGTSLEKLAINLDKKDFLHLRNHFPQQEQFELIIRKGVYPYEHMTDWKSYQETILPPRKSFHSTLCNSTISKSDYKHAEMVWKAFNIKNLGEYTDIYLKSDVLLLSDIFEKFRRTCKTNYNLDPAFYITAPSLSFDAMLLKTKVKLQLIEDLEIIRMIQKGIRGGVCLCSTRYAKANNMYLSSYDPTSSNSFLLYTDCNNLYGYAMCSYLPHSDFQMMKPSEFQSLNILEVSDDAEYGYILEVDLEYPEHLHDLHNDLPFCPQKFIPPGSKTAKLIPNLYDKFYYVIHYVHLKTCLRHGLLLKKVHRVIKFKQSAYLKQYIDLNTQFRQKATSTFEQDFFKLLNNSIFGKTLEDPEKRLDVKLVNQWVDNRHKTKHQYTAERLIARPNYHSSTVFSENLVAVQLKPETIKLDKPIYIGFTVLEISKSHMYDFHYSIIKPFYKQNVQLCYTDTDSFLYSIQTNDVYADLKLRFKSYFDTSNYIDNNVYGIVRENKKVPGMFKDELGGQPIEEFVGLRSKLYCIKSKNNAIKKAKGIKKNVVEQIDFNDYEKVLKHNDVIRKNNTVFKSIKHKIFTQSINKIALSSNDDKRIILKNKISTMAWGHKNSIF